jgi:hypothetical protein
MHRVRRRQFLRQDVIGGQEKKGRYHECFQF